MKIIHVNRNVIDSNRKHGRTDPAISVRTGKNGRSQNYSEVEILGPSKMVYSPEKPLNCGARLWLETEAEISCR